MPRIFGILLFAAGLAAIFSSCNEPRKESPASEEPPGRLREKLIYANREIMHNEKNEINKYINSHSFQMDSTGTGLRYMIYFRTNGKKTSAGKKVSVAFSLSLLDGTKCSSAGKEKPFVFVIGHGSSTRGMEEGVLLMKEGEKARLIVPAHLGYGLLGDGGKVTPDATLLYDVELLHVE